MSEAQQKMVRGPRRWTKGELARVGVEYDEATQAFRCLECKGRWWVCSPGGGRRLGRGYWHCPQGCNH
jgi:hypothetical protein